MVPQRPRIRGVSHRSKPGLPTVAYLPILSPKAGQTVAAISLAEMVSGYDVHFWENRTINCGGDADDCELCARHCRQYWKGYLPGFLPASGMLCIIEITEGAYWKCDTFRRDVYDVRGWLLQLKRFGKGPKGPVQVELLERKPGQNLPAAFDLDIALQRVWNGVQPVQTKKQFERDVIHEIRSAGF